MVEEKLLSLEDLPQQTDSSYKGDIRKKELNKTKNLHTFGKSSSDVTGKKYDDSDGDVCFGHLKNIKLMQQMVD